MQTNIKQHSLKYCYDREDKKFCPTFICNLYTTSVAICNNAMYFFKFSDTTRGEIRCSINTKQGEKILKIIILNLKN